MTLFIIKTFEIAAEPETAKDQVKHIIVPEKYYEFVKSYWYKWIHEPDLKNIFPGDHKMFVIYPVGSSAEDLSGSLGYAIVNGCTIELLVVSPKCQGQGLGSKLLEYIKEYIRNEDRKEHKYCKVNKIYKKKIRLEVHVLNTGAIRLYRRHGFKLVDSRGEYLVMQCALITKKTANPSKETINPCQRIKAH